MKIKKIIDLSWPISEVTPIYPGDPVPKLDVFTTIGNIGYNLFSVYMGTQTGTHVDAPYHLVQNAKAIDEMPLDMFFGQAVVIDVSSKRELETITLPDIEQYKSDLEKYHIVLFKTNWNNRLSNQNQIYTELFLKHPYLDMQTCEYLIKSGIKLICIDTLNLDRSFNATKFPIHVKLAESNIMVAENMINFDLIDFKHPIIAAFPLSFIGCDGSPVRAVAIEMK